MVSHSVLFSKESDKVHVFPAIPDHSSSVEQYSEPQPPSSHKLSSFRAEIFDRTLLPREHDSLHVS